MATVNNAPAKPWYKSRTIIVNTLLAAGYFLMENAGTLPVSPETTVLIISGINVVLRVITKGKLTVK